MWLQHRCGLNSAVSSWEWREINWIRESWSGKCWSGCLLAGEPNNWNISPATSFPSEQLEVDRIRLFHCIHMEAPVQIHRQSTLHCWRVKTLWRVKITIKLTTNEPAENNTVASLITWIELVEIVLWYLHRKLMDMFSLWMRIELHNLKLFWEEWELELFKECVPVLAYIFYTSTVHEIKVCVSLSQDVASGTPFGLFWCPCSSDWLIPL